ncbi:MAG: hypothetical protein M1816_001662 [Peltula sp. TS41687]|nr:MAG: hypothetical protein M1816_001662 [Peltula sp. TS41687]
MDHASRMGQQRFNSTESPQQQHHHWNEANVHTPSPVQEKDRPISPLPLQGYTDVESPEVVSPGLEPVWGLQADKEVYHEPAPPQYPEQPAPAKKRICGLSRRLFWILLALVLLLLVGLGAGLGAGLGTKKKSSSSSPAAAAPVSSNSSTRPVPVAPGDPRYSIGGSLDPAYYSKKGAFNGSGIALASQSFEGSEHGSIVLYFQHHTGTIRWQQLTDGKWLGGSQSEIVADDAKNATPISAVAYAKNNVSSWHIFYIDEDNYIRQKSGNNKTSLWTNGTLNSLNLKAAPDAGSVGLQACWYGSFYGDADYGHSPAAADGSGATTYPSEVGMHLWYASNATTVEQYGWRDGDKGWTRQNTWNNKNGHAGVGCYSWGPGTVTYVMMVNLQETVEVWWKDTNTTLKGNKTHPINEWTNSSISIPNVHPSTSLGYTNFFYAQMADTYAIKGYNISYRAENTSIVQEDTLTVQVQGGPSGLPGTHFSVSTIPDTSGGNSLIVFYQQQGDDITMYTRDFKNGQWTYVPLPIPDR